MNGVPQWPIPNARQLRPSPFLNAIAANREFAGPTERACVIQHPGQVALSAADEVCTILLGFRNCGRIMKGIFAKPSISVQMRTISAKQIVIAGVLSACRLLERGSRGPAIIFRKSAAVGKTAIIHITGQRRCQIRTKWLGIPSQWPIPRAGSVCVLVSPSAESQEHRRAV